MANLMKIRDAKFSAYGESYGWLAAFEENIQMQPFCINGAFGREGAVSNMKKE